MAERDESSPVRSTSPLSTESSTEAETKEATNSAEHWQALIEQEEAKDRAQLKEFADQLASLGVDLQSTHPSNSSGVDFGPNGIFSNAWELSEAIRSLNFGTLETTKPSNHEK